MATLLYLKEPVEQLLSINNQLSLDLEKTGIHLPVFFYVLGMVCLKSKPTVLYYRGACDGYAKNSQEMRV